MSSNSINNSTLIDILDVHYISPGSLYGKVRQPLPLISTEYIIIIIYIITILIMSIVDNYPRNHIRIFISNNRDRSSKYGVKTRSITYGSME